MDFIRGVCGGKSPCTLNFSELMLLTVVVQSAFCVTKSIALIFKLRIIILRKMIDQKVQLEQYLEAIIAALTH